MKKSITRATLMGVAALLAASHLAVGAAPIDATGNPITDGWGSSLGRSTDAGVFVEGRGFNNAAPFDFNVYQTTYTIGAGSNLLFSADWQVGDTVLGLGGVVNQTYDTTFRGVMKFGGVNSDFSAATQNIGNCIGAQCGAAKGSLSSGDGGLGSVLIAFNYTRNASGNITTGFDATARRPTNFRYYNGAEINHDSNSAVREFARIIADFDTTGNDVVLSWQGLLNVSAMERSGTFALTGVPTAGANSIVTFQRSDNATQYTEALVQQPTSHGVPVPASLPLVALALAGLWATKRRQG